MTALLAALWLAPAQAQVWVAPRRPGQSIVRNSEQEWQTLDLLVDAEIRGTKAGGIRLFFYETERLTAERAAAQIEMAYQALAEQFDYVPVKRFDYVLYATYQEFLKTNLFPLQEGVLGVTATQGLHMAVPYMGDHQTYQHTSTHELAHEFTIQKVRTAAKLADVWRDPLDPMPLWFIEGLAEYMSQGPIEGENAMRVRDLVANPDLYTGHGLLSFWDDWPGYVLWTYQGGHSRITFLEEVYGEGTVRRILELSPAMVTDQGYAARIQRFDRLVQEITGDKPKRVAERYEDWVKRKTYAEWLEADQGVDEFEIIEEVVGITLALDASPDGNLLAYRSIAPDTGRSALYVADRRTPRVRRRIAADGRPGVESLHPIDPRNFDVVSDRIAYVAESRGRDRIVIRELEHKVTQQDGPQPGIDELGEGETKLPIGPPTPEPWWKIKLRRGKKQIITVDAEGIAAISSLALEPGGERVVLVGLSNEGQRDLWLASPNHKGSDLRRLTNDVHAERDVAWGKDGLVFASDASADGHMHLFLLDPDGESPPQRLTRAARDHVSPTVLADGTIVYTGYEEDRAELFAMYEGETVRLTDLATGAFEPATGPDGGIWSLVLHGGQMRPALMRSGVLRAERDIAPGGAQGPAGTFPTRPTGSATAYQPLDIRNWSIDGGFAAIGAGPGGVFGQLYLSFSDRLRDHGLVLLAQAYGTPELTDAQLLYLNQRARVTYGGGPFHALRFRVDQTLKNAPFTFQSGERYYGGLVSVRYPLNRFVYLQGDAAIGGVSYFLYGSIEDLLADPVANGSGRNLLAEWQDTNTDPRFQAESAFRVGVDTTRYHPKTGPVAGTSVLTEVTGGVQPFDDQQFASVRLDAQQYLPIPFVSGGNVGLRGSAASSFGGPYAVGYWLSSYDTLRGYQWGDPALLGRHYWFGNAELQLPLDVLVRLAVASGIEGVAGLDFGAIADDTDELWNKRVLDVALGTNFILGPLVLRLHFARAIDIGAPLPVTNRPWVTNFSISWLSF